METALNQANKKKVIFIGGSSYSGSTMLDMMISNTCEGFSAGEVEFLFQPLRPHHYSPECGCGDTECTLWHDVYRAGANRLYKTIFRRFENITFIVDSSKDPWWFLKQSRSLKRQNIDVFHILIWKEPEAFSHSKLKRRQKEWRKSWVNYHRLYFSLIKDYTCIPYKTLARDPEKTLSDLCLNIGLPFRNGQERFWEKKHHTLFGNNSTKYHIRGDQTLTANKSAMEQNLKRHDYRSIYYENKYQSELPQTIRQAIKTDEQIQKIYSALRNRHTPDNSIKFSPARLMADQVVTLIRALLGRTIGRYWRWR